MKKIVEMAVYVCDNCGEILNDGEDHVCFIDEDIWHCCEHEWIEHEGKHYCPSCYELDDDDKVVLKNW